MSFLTYTWNTTFLNLKINSKKPPPSTIEVCLRFKKKKNWKRNSEDILAKYVAGDITYITIFSKWFSLSSLKKS